ncbi:MAG: hypothetical protein OCU24_06770 [Candidatus Methanospirare jalkutatii]|nr:hypothetical protein [Candidatus Methanospirare jalkutatii]
MSGFGIPAFGMLVAIALRQQAGIRLLLWHSAQILLRRTSDMLVVRNCGRLKYENLSHGVMANYLSDRTAV